MDDLDRQLLNTIQTGFPINPCPYRVLGESLGISEEEALNRVRALADAGIIRRIGPSFDTRRLGHVSILIVSEVLPEKLEQVANTVSSYPQVTHNYGRDHRYNLWFTLVCRDLAEVQRVLGEIRQMDGVLDLHELPAERMFKIRVEFDFT